MNFQQLRSLREAARRGFNLTEVARVLNTSQPGVSRQIRELEDELGVDLFVRAGKRLTALTEMGELVLPTVENMLRDADNLRRAGDEFSQQLQGPLSIAATHSQARYALPGAVRDFRVRFPGVRFNLHQGSPDQVADMLITGEADVGIAMGTGTDPYQRAEGRYRLMRGIIRALIDYRNPFSILTKGTLILRDIDLAEDATQCRVKQS